METFLAFTVVGIVTGAIYAVSASGLVVTYTTSGIFNFAHGAIGMFMAFTYWELRIHRHWPAPIALIVVLFILSPLMGAVIERTMMRRLYAAPMRVAIVTTLALFSILQGIAQSIWDPQKGRRLPEFFAGSDFKLFGVRVTYHQVVVLLVAGLIAAGLRFLMFHTRTGVTMRAVVDNRSLASMNGVYPERIAQLTWAIGAILAALAGILIAPTITLNHGLLALLVVNGYAAAMLGRLRNLPLTFAGALIIGLAQSYIIGYGGGVHFGSFRLIDTSSVVPTVFLFGILVFMSHTRLRAGRVVGMRAPRVPTLRWSLGASAVFIVFIALVSTSLSEFWLFNFSMAMVLGIVMLSLVMLSGYAGQISLMQMTFVGIGAVAASRLGNGTVLGLITAGVVAAIFGGIVALPALRLQELYLALTTAALALFGDWAFAQSWGFGGGGGILTMKRLKLPGVAFNSEQSQLLLVTVAFCVIAVLVLAVKRSAYGRRFAALADSPLAASTLGMNLVASKTMVFALSAGIAGVAGALFGGLHVTVSANDFTFFLGSVAVFLVASFGGLTTVTGALFGGAFLAVVVPELQQHIHVQSVQFLGVGAGAIALASNPHGFGGSVAEMGEQLREAINKWRQRPSGQAVPARGAATS